MFSIPSNFHIVERGWLCANQIYVHDGSHLDIVDSGFCLHADQTVRLLKSYLNSLPKVSPRTLITTHLHSDHCGGNQALQHHFSLKCLVPEAEFYSLTNWSEANKEFKSLGQPCPEFKADGFISIGQTIQLGDTDFEVHGTPGHHPNSILLYAPSLKLLISADALWESGFGALFSEITHGTGFLDQRSSLDIISSLDIDTVIPGHGRPFCNVEQALQVAYSRLDYFESNPHKNTLHVAHVLFQFMVMFTTKLTIDEGISWCRDTPLFVQCALRLNRSVEDLFHETLSSLNTKDCLELKYDSILYRYSS